MPFTPRREEGVRERKVTVLKVAFFLWRVWGGGTGDLLSKLRGGRCWGHWVDGSGVWKGPDATRLASTVHACRYGRRLCCVLLSTYFMLIYAPDSDAIMLSHLPVLT